MQRYIFLHQVKTAGKTIEKFLVRKYKGDYCKTTIVFEEESLNNIFDILKSTDKDKIAKISNAKAISGHFPFGIHNMLEGDSRYFTLLRDPVNRVRSFYAYSLKNEGSKIQIYLQDNNVSFEQFVQMEKKDIDKSGVHELNYILEDGQAKIIASEDILVGEGSTEHLMKLALLNIKQHFDFVGVTELFDDSFIEISKLLGLGPFNLYITQNKSKVKVNVSDDIKNIILERNPVDSQLHSIFYNEMQTASKSVIHKLAKSYLKVGSTAADFYVKMRN